jgi:hypothetical protein
MGVTLAQFVGARKLGTSAQKYPKLDIDPSKFNQRINQKLPYASKELSKPMDRDYDLPNNLAADDHFGNSPMQSMSKHD